MNSADFGCLLADADGQAYEERPGFMLDVKIALDDEEITHLMRPAGENNTFKFTALKSHKNKIRIDIAMLDSSSDGGSLEKFDWNLEDVLIPVTNSDPNETSRWKIYKLENSEKRVLEDTTNKLYLSWPTQKLLNNDARKHCDTLEATPISSQKLSDWRLPTEDEIVSFNEGSVIKHLDQAWFNEFKETAPFWTSSKKDKKKIARSLSSPSLKWSTTSEVSYRETQ